MSAIEPVSVDHRLRICVAGDLDGIHTRSWLSYFVARGHDVHAIAYHAPARPPEGVTVHALRPAAGSGGDEPVTSSAYRSYQWGLCGTAQLLRFRGDRRSHPGP